MVTPAWARATKGSSNIGIDGSNALNDTADGSLVLLVERARVGEERAWRSLVDQHTALLWKVARNHRLSDADAADVIQVTWLRCVQHLDTIRDPHLLPAWLITTCHRECLRTIRRRARDVPADVTDPAGPFARVADTSIDADPAEPVLAQERAAVLNEAISRLPEHQQRVLGRLMQSTGEHGRRYAEIAAALGMPQGSLGPTRQRALRRLSQDAQVIQLRQSS
jgi:RNA polymerase sigma factor (sigma-70 family)